MVMRSGCSSFLSNFLLLFFIIFFDRLGLNLSAGATRCMRDKRLVIILKSAPVWLLLLLSSLLDTASVLVERLTDRVSVEAGPQLCRAAVSLVTLTSGMAVTFSSSSYSRRSGDRRRGP